jgi:CMP-N-acetylneuraminic acid synthetase
MKVVALLPMKANSERVKGKNFRDFGGKPLFYWILDTLKSVSAIDTIVINTDARYLLLEHGLVEGDRVIIRDRKLEICGDYVSMNLVIYDDIQNINADLYLMTHTTNPFLTKKSIEAAISKFKTALQSGKADSLFSVNKIQERFYDGDAKPINHDPNNLLRTQDLEPWYKENSNLYLFTKESFNRTNARIGKNPMILEMDYYESTDIDTPDDWDLAEAMIEHYKKRISK